MSGKGRAEDEPLAEPSWLTAQSEADTASRRLAQASASLERLSRELTSLREWGDTTARLEVAHALSDGPDGGALAVLTMAAATPTADGTLRRVAGGSPTRRPAPAASPAAWPARAGAWGTTSS